MSKTTPTKDSIRAEFEELVEKDSFWSKFVGSQFVSMLTLFITQIVYRCFQYADAALAEGFISTATRRSSILAAAETNSYVGTKPTPSSGMIEITATSEDAPAVIPKNMPLISDDQYPYMTMDVCRLVDGTGTVEVAQLEIQEVTYTVTAAKEFLEVVLSKALTAVCYKLEVFVTTDGKTTQWSSSTMFRLAGSKSQVYVEFYKPSEQLGVRFGDGLIGQIPPEGSTITLKVWCTNGDITLVAGQNLTPVDSAANLANLISVKTTTPITAGNWDVKTLDKQVDVTPDEDAVMQKISGGVSIAGINDIISCDDFYRFQQRGMIKITDSYGVQTTESGYSIDFVGTYTDPLKHAVYPDRRDGALKSSIAKWVLGMMSEGNNRQVRLAEVFLTELFGSNYGDVIASYGDTLSPEALQEKIADSIAKMPEKTSQGATRNGDSELEVTNAIFGTHEFRASDYEITTAQFGTIGIYSNKDEIKQAMDVASARIAAEREANLNHAVAALTQSWVTAIREAATTGKITPAIADVVNDGSKFMDAYQMDAVKLPSAYGQLSYRMTYNLVSMFSDLAILGLVDLNEVTPELLSMRKNHVEILQRINTVLAGRTDEEKQADADRINLALGNITEEEIAARNEKQEELSSIQGDATSIAQSLGLNYRVSTADLKMMYAPKFAAGEVFGLQEASGMKGVLFRAKDAIKAKFGARWLPAKAKNSDFPGNWWIIETKHNVADVLAVIQQYA